MGGKGGGCASTGVASKYESEGLEGLRPDSGEGVMGRVGSCSGVGGVRRQNIQTRMQSAVVPKMRKVPKGTEWCKNIKVDRKMEKKKRCMSVMLIVVGGNVRYVDVWAGNDRSEDLDRVDIV